MENVKTKNFVSTKQMVLIGFMAALSYVLMLFPIPFKYLGFLELELSDIPAIICGIAYGPVFGILIELIKNLVKAITVPQTGGVGELANFIVSVGYVFPTCFLYRKFKGENGKKNILAFAAGIIGMSIMGIIINYYVTVPLYARMFGGMDAIVGACAGTIPAISGLGTIVILGITPFNIVKGIFISIIGYITYVKFKKVLQ